MMLYPSMAELLEKVDSRYLLVNVIAKRARELSSEGSDTDIGEEKAVSAEGKIEVIRNEEEDDA